MRLIGYLLMTAALCAGTVAATTAYVPKLVPQDVEGLTLNAVSGLATPDTGAVINHAALTPVYAAKAVADLRDDKRGKPRVEVRFAIGADHNVTLDHPGDIGLVVIADAQAMPSFAEELGLEATSQSTLIALGLFPAQIRKLTEPMPKDNNDGSFTAVEPSTAVEVPGGVAVPLPLPEGVPGLWSLNAADRFALRASLAIDPDVRQATLQRLYPALAEAKAQELKALQAALDIAHPKKDKDKEDKAKKPEAAPKDPEEAKAKDPAPSLFINDEGHLMSGATAEKGKLIPIAQPRDVLTPELLTALGATGTQRVRVKEFAFARWEHAWLMGLSVVVLIVGVVLVRSATKKMIAKSVADAATSTETPEAAMTRIRTCLDRAIATTGTHDLLVPLTEIQRDHINVIIDSRNLLVGRMGLSGYAAFMDEFSAFERQVNRAWSAAADNASVEAFESVRNAHEMAPAVHEHLMGH